LAGLWDDTGPVRDNYQINMRRERPYRRLGKYAPTGLSYLGNFVT